MDGMRVLIADDSSASRKFIATLLEEWGYDVVHCEDGTGAWRILRGPDAPPMAILDWIMPGLNGPEVCRRLREAETERHTLVFLLTGRDSVNDMLRGLEAGADDYLTKPVLEAELRVRLRNGHRLVQLQRECTAAKEALRVQAMMDPLTQTFNRRAFTELAEKELSRTRRRKRPVGLMMVDLDHFKQINDRHGHPAGDAVLSEAASRMQRVIRLGDHLGRFGGEEFVVLLADCKASGAFTAGERLRAEMARDPVRFGDATIPVTASIGVAASPDGSEPLQSLVARADRALYVAKGNGRNRTSVAEPLRDGDRGRRG